MKSYILIFLILVSGLTIAQTSGEILYEIQIKETILENENKNKNLTLVNNAISENINNFEFRLQFLNTESLFNTVKSMNSDNSNVKLKIASAMLETKNEYYINSEKKIKITALSAYGENFIITESLPKWVLHKDKKKIGNYLCYKATCVLVVKNSKGTFNKNVEAWYAPNLIFSFGPKGYGGLPGLILELTEDKYVYSVKKINLKKVIKNIIPPKKGKKITREELLKIGENSSF